MTGRWSDSQVHIMAGHRLLSQAGHSVATSSAAEILTRLDLHAMTFSDSSAPYPFREAPGRVWIDEVMLNTFDLESYAQAGTALFGLMRRIMMLGERTAGGGEEDINNDLKMLEDAIQDLAAWEYKMGQFENTHPNLQDKSGATSIRLYHTLLRTFLRGGAFGSEMRWDDLLGLFERILTLAEMLWSETPNCDVYSPLSLEPGIIVPVFMVAQRCRHPWLRRRAITLLYKLKRQEGMWFSDGAAVVSQKIMEIEGQVYFESDLGKEESPWQFATEDIPWDVWATTDLEKLPARTSWAGIDKVPEEMRMRETMVMVSAEEKRVELSLIMSSMDDPVGYGEVRTETITYG
ncbi:hypothetical protein ACHAPU_006001 [Fusarium lateritium]